MVLPPNLNPTSCIPLPLKPRNLGCGFARFVADFARLWPHSKGLLSVNSKEDPSTRLGVKGLSFLGLEPLVWGLGCRGARVGLSVQGLAFTEGQVTSCCVHIRFGKEYFVELALWLLGMHTEGNLVPVGSPSVVRYHMSRISLDGEILYLSCRSPCKWRFHRFRVLV